MRITYVAKVEIHDPQHLYLSNHLHTSPKLGEMSTFSLNLSEHETDDVKINNLAA